MEWIGFGFDLDLIFIEIGVFKNFKECARSPCNGNHFSSMCDVLLEVLLQNDLREHFKQRPQLSPSDTTFVLLERVCFIQPFLQ